MPGNRRDASILPAPLSLAALEVIGTKDSRDFYRTLSFYITEFAFIQLLVPFPTAGYPCTQIKTRLLRFEAKHSCRLNFLF